MTDWFLPIHTLLPSGLRLSQERHFRVDDFRLSTYIQFAVSLLQWHFDKLRFRSFGDFRLSVRQNPYQTPCCLYYVER